jgi:hypothetical protein
MSTDLFQKLPPEVILLIVKDTADFVGLNSLIHASKWIANVISHYLFDITEELLASFPMTRNGNEKLFLFSSFINEPGLKCSDLDDLQSKFTDLSLGNFNEKTIYRTLRQGAHIQRLACACISKLRENLEIGLESAMDAEWEKSLFPDWRQQMTAEASWVEESRVYRALWCLQILSDIYHASGPVALQNDSGGWGWTSTEREKLPSFKFSFRANQNEPNCVAEVLKHLGASCVVPSDGPINVETTWGISPRYLSPIFESLQVKGLQNYPIWTPPTPPGRTMFGHPKNQSLESVWGRDPGSLSGSIGMRVWWNLYIRQRRSLRQDPPFRNAKTCHQTGIFIWDNWRLVSVGLVQAAGMQYRFPTPDFSQWFEATTLDAPRKCMLGTLVHRWSALAETRV